MMKECMVGKLIWSLLSLSAVLRGSHWLHEIHSAIKTKEYPCAFRKRECQYYGFQRGGVDAHQDIADTAGKSVLKLESEAWLVVLLLAGICVGQP